MAAVINKCVTFASKAVKNQFSKRLTVRRIADQFGFERYQKRLGLSFEIPWTFRIIPWIAINYCQFIWVPFKSTITKLRSTKRHKDNSILWISKKCLTHKTRKIEGALQLCGSKYNLHFRVGTISDNRKMLPFSSEVLKYYIFRGITVHHIYYLLRYQDLKQSSQRSFKMGMAMLHKTRLKILSV